MDPAFGMGEPACGWLKTRLFEGNACGMPRFERETRLKASRQTAKEGQTNTNRKKLVRILRNRESLSKRGVLILFC